MAYITGTSGRDRLFGTMGDDILQGYAGDDSLYGRAGNDIFYAGPGSDWMYGGTGNDSYVVDSYDTVIEAEDAGYDAVLAMGSFVLAAGSSIERLQAHNPGASGPLDLYGNEFNNVISGNAGHNFIDGGAGNDSLSGLGGDDVLNGGGGRDRLIGGAGADLFVFSNYSWDKIDDFVSGTDSIELGGLMEFDEFTFIGSSSFSGTAGEGRFANGLFQLDIDGDSLADLQITLVTGQLQASDITFAIDNPWAY